jgi:hypothetical protein
MYNEENRAKQLAKAAARGAGRGGAAKGEKGGDNGTGSTAPKNRLVDTEGDINVGKLDTQMNPLFMSKGVSSGGESATAGFGVGKDASDAILSQRNAPSQELWIVFQNEYRETREALQRSNTQLAEAKKAAQKASVAADLDVDAGGGGASSGPRKKAFGPTSASGAGGAGSEGGAFASFKASARGPAMRSMRKGAAATSE